MEMLSPEEQRFLEEGLPLRVQLYEVRPLLALNREAAG